MADILTVNLTRPLLWLFRAGPQGKVGILGSGGFQSIWVWAILQTIAFALALPLTIGLGMLLAWHVQLVLTNKTTIEFQEVG